MARIGILTCSSVTQEIPCGCFGCLMAFNGRQGEFARYANDNDVQLIGVINCAGCPTAKAPERILNRVRAMVGAGATTIHLSFCLMEACPYKKKYASLITEHFPTVQVVEGTHPAPDGEKGETFKGLVSDQLKSKKTTMVELACQAGLIEPGN